MQGGRKPLGQSLVELGNLSAEGLARALEEQRRTGTALREVLLRLNLAPESAILEYYEEQLGIPRMDLSTYVLEPEIVHLLPDRVARQYTVLPLFKIGSTLTIAMADPLDVVALDEVKKSTGLEVDVVVSSESQIKEAIDRLNPVGAGLDQLAREQALRQVAAEVVARPEEDGPIIRFVNAVVQQAVREGASDLHLEPEESSFRIRLRVDGILREVSIQAKALFAPVVSRVKIMAALDIAERRLPQDGRIRMSVMGRDLDLRVSTFPTIHGENVVLRLQDRSAAMIDLKELGLAPQPLSVLERMIKKPNGIVLVTGPTGSGKTTTLYACIHRINSVERNIVTLEDPVEFYLSTIRQTQVDPDAGLTFARGLRALLRQDPDIVMVGEIRDPETAEISVRSALTGHLVLSTLHTNDAPSTINRMVDMGIEPFLVASSTNLIMAQRLLRKICNSCKSDVKLHPEVLRELGLSDEAARKENFKEGKGCVDCNNTGYKGRMGVYEVMPMSPKIKDQVLDRASTAAIKKTAVADGMLTLRADALIKLKNGITTAEEVLKETATDH